MKTNVLMLTSMIAGGLSREEGKIYALDAGVADAVFKGHKGRAPSPEDVARLGVTPDPERASDVGVVPSRPASVREQAKAARAAKAAGARSGRGSGRGAQASE